MMNMRVGKHTDAFLSEPMANTEDKTVCSLVSWWWGRLWAGSTIRSHAYRRQGEYSTFGEN